MSECWKISPPSRHRIVTFVRRAISLGSAAPLVRGAGVEVQCANGTTTVLCAGGAVIALEPGDSIEVAPVPIAIEGRG